MNSKRIIIKEPKINNLMFVKRINMGGYNSILSEEAS